MNHSTPVLPVHHQLPESTQPHVHRVGDAIQPSHPRSSPSPPAPDPSQHQALFQWVSSSHQVASHSDSCVVIPHCFTLWFSTDRWLWTSFHVNICQLDIFLGEGSVYIFCSFRFLFLVFFTGVQLIDTAVLAPAVQEREPFIHTYICVFIHGAPVHTHVAPVRAHIAPVHT